jgi:GGDEF domain-containing protein
MRLPHRRPAPRTAVSIGAATLGEDGGDFQTLYARADAALYRQKTARHRIAAATPPAPVIRT